MALTAGELHRRGIEAANARRFVQARRLLVRASARADDHDLRARIDGTLAYVLSQIGDPAAAERLSREALKRTGLSPRTIAVVNGQLGTLLMHSGQLDEANTMLTMAIESTDIDPSEIANCLMNRSIVNMQQHRLDDCVADLERAICFYETHGNEECLAEARHNLGYAALLRGDLVTALTQMTRSRPTLAATSDLAAAISDLDRAEVLRDAGLSTEAEELLAQVAQQFGNRHMRQARAEAEFHLARSLLRHDPMAAERTAARAARRFASIGSASWAARSDAIRLEARVRARPRARHDIDEFRRTSSALARGGFATEATGLCLTVALIDGRRMPRIPANAPTPLRLKAHQVRAVRAVRSGRTAEARRIAAAGLDLLTTWQQSFGALDLQASIAMHGSELLRIGLTSAAQTRNPQTVFEWSERSRHMGQQVAPVRPPHDAELAADLAELRMLRADLVGSDWTTDSRVRALGNRVRERQWSSTAAGKERARVSLARARAGLNAHTAILAFVFTGTDLLCVVANDVEATVVTLSWPRVRAALSGLRADLDVMALVPSGPMASLIERSLDERLAVLDRELFAPVRAASQKAERYIVTIPGVLAGLPWGMLPGMAGIPYTLSTSVSRWLDDSRPSPHEEPGSPGESPHRRSIRTAGFAAGPRVGRGPEEVEAAMASWAQRAAACRVSAVTGNDATVAAVIDLAGRQDVLHIAAHGRHAADNPLFSGFELSDGTLFGYDVDLIPHVPDTVVLSACELGRSSVRWGEEAVGMTRVWLHAGSKCVIAAPVVVADDIACELLGAVHAELASGADPADALSAASLATGLRTPFQCHGSGL